MNSVDNDKVTEKASELYSYLLNNKDSLVPYQNREIKLPELNDGLVCKGMGNGVHGYGDDTIEKNNDKPVKKH